MGNEKSAVISNIAKMLLQNNKAKAKEIIRKEYPHEYFEIEKRSYTMAQKMKQFINDGFIDRYIYFEVKQ